MENKILFRCSGIGNLMTDPKTKADKEAGVLSETAKSFVTEMWLHDKYGYKEILTTPEIKKGNVCEQDGMALIQEVLGGKFRLKNKDRISNDYIIGTPDIITEDAVEDIKIAYTIKTFHNAELSKNYYYQLMSYLALTGKQKARLLYCLVSTPEDEIMELEKRQYYHFGCDESNKDYIANCEQIRRNHRYDHIPAKDRLKVWEFDRDDTVIAEIYRRCEQAKEFYKSIKL